ARRAQGGEMELAALWRARPGRMVPEPALLQSLHQGRVPQWCPVATAAAGTVQAPADPLPACIGRGSAGRGPLPRLGEAGERAARRTHVIFNLHPANPVTP